MTETKIESIPTDEKAPTAMLKHSTVLAGDLFVFLGPNLDSTFATLIFGAFPLVPCTGFPSAQVLCILKTKIAAKL